MEDKVLKCHQCGLPWARLQGGSLVVESRHHGEKHVNAVAIADLVRRYWQGEGEILVVAVPEEWVKGKKGIGYGPMK